MHARHVIVDTRHAIATPTNIFGFHNGGNELLTVPSARSAASDTNLHGTIQRLSSQRLSVQSPRAPTSYSDQSPATQRDVFERPSRSPKPNRRATMRLPLNASAIRTIEAREQATLNYRAISHSPTRKNRSTVRKYSQLLLANPLHLQRRYTVGECAYKLD